MAEWLWLHEEGVIVKGEGVKGNFFFPFFFNRWRWQSSLLGTSNTGSGLNEKEVLTGGSGVDKFILGNASGSFYKQNGNKDFAEITDFAFGEQIQLGTGDVFNIQINKSGFNIFAVKDNQNDLIAKVTISSSANLRTSTATLDNAASSLLDTLPTGNFLLPAGGSNGIFVSA